MSRPPIRLPIDPFLPQLIASLMERPNLVLTASPGAGKTTRVPAAIMQSGLLAPDAPGILMLEPRRLAARAAATRIAFELGCEVGTTIGYQVRFENRTSAQTRVCVITEGLLNRRLATDPRLQGIGCVILDEFHERSWHSDLGLGLLRELQALERPDLRIIVMSATLQAAPIANFLGEATILDVAADAHPIDVHHEREPQLLTSGPALFQRVSRTISDVAHGRRPGSGDILVFLPGVREINMVAGSLQSLLQDLDVEIHTLHGSLRLEEQNRTLAPSSRRKIILATNIAETSLTIDGVATVIDSGLARVMWQEGEGFPHLELTRISRFSMRQRTGRAGRQGPGICHRLWNPLDEASMAESETPEILRTDLSEACLLLASLGISDFNAFSWFEKPPATAISSATLLLQALGAISHARDGLMHLTDVGRRLLTWPIHPRLARLLDAAGNDHTLMTVATRLAAIISERDFLTSPQDVRDATALESDTLLRLEFLHEHISSRAIDFGALQSVRRAVEQLERIARGRKSPREASIAEASIAKDDESTAALQLLLLAFPDRVGRRRRMREPEARMVGGKGVRLARTSSVQEAELFVAIAAFGSARTNASGSASTNAFGSANDIQVTHASRIERAWLQSFFPQHVREVRQVAFDPASEQIRNEVFLAYHDLPLEEPRHAPARAEDIARLLPELVTSRWSKILGRNEFALEWLARYAFLRETFAERPWPDWNFQDPQHPEMQKIIAALCLGETSLEAVTAKDMRWHFENALGADLGNLIRLEAPETIVVPTGNRIRVHYPLGRPPYLEVRLQEVFGWRQTPVVAAGRVRIILHLLGPNFRPVQVTADLSSFWANGYPEVRKELRSRYPKHSWPEDPLTAPPVAKGRPRQ